MQFHVTLKVKDAIIGDHAVRVREEIGKQMQHALGSGKVQASGTFADARQSYFIVEVATAEEMYDLFGPTFYDVMDIESHPVFPVERLGEFFARWGQQSKEVVLDYVRDP